MNLLYNYEYFLCNKSKIISNKETIYLIKKIFIDYKYCFLSVAYDVRSIHGVKIYCKVNVMKQIGNVND